MSNFFVKSLKEKNIKENSNSFNSSYKKSLKSKKNKDTNQSIDSNDYETNIISQINGRSPLNNKKKFMITPPNENLYRKKNVNTVNTNIIHEKSNEHHSETNNTRIGYTFNENNNLHNHNKKNYKSSPRKINYSNCSNDDYVANIQTENKMKMNKKILNGNDIKNILLNNISNSPNSFNIINNENINEPLDENSCETNNFNSMNKILCKNTTTSNLQDISYISQEQIDIQNNIYNINYEKQYDTNIENCKSINENKNENEKYTSINKLNFSSLQKEPTVTFIQKDKIKLYNYNIMFDNRTNKFLTYPIETQNLDTNSSFQENKIPCYYCRRNFENAPFGLPICYYPSVYIIKNNSQNLKYSFNYKENTIKLNSNEKERLLNILETTQACNMEVDSAFLKTKENKKDKYNDKDCHQIVTRQFFETEGIFCSFNCLVSYLEENRNNPLYQNSYNLIYFMYKTIFGVFPQQTIIRSPSWKLRKEYGGPLSDEDYSKYIQNIPIIDSNQLKSCVSKHESIYEVLV